MTRAIHRAEHATDLRERVCEAAVSAGYETACYLEGGETLTVAGEDGARPPTDAVDAEFTTVDGDSRHWILVPVSYGDTRYGTFALATDHTVEDETRSERLVGVGETIGHGIANTEEMQARQRIAGELHEERRQFEKLHSVAAQMVGCEDEQSIYQLAIDAAENILDFDICGIDVVEGDWLVPKALSTDMESSDSERIPTDEGVAGETFQESKRIIVADVSEYADADPTNPDYRSILSIPIEGVGVFQAASERRDAFSDRDAELAELLMAHVAETLKRLRSEEALRESEEKYRTLVEQSHDAVAIFRDGSYEFVNDRATELFGRDEEALRNAEGWSLIHPEDRAELRAIHEELVVEAGRQRTFEARIRRPSGDVRYCEFSVTSIDYDGDVASLSSIRDITERKEREWELERQNERLEEFASVVSHDLRSPINVAQGSVDLTQQTGEEEHLDRAEDALERMEALVEDILDLARQGRHVDETEPVDLAEVGTEAWESVDAPDATLATDVAATVAADRGRLRELFENLFRNAVEHAGEDVTVTLTDCEDGFAVVDDGPGIPDGAHEAVFERGYTSVDDGTGFGLAIVENIAEAHDWTIEAVPTDGPGARFEITGVNRAD
ncbi:PAS domain S-box protein [Halobacterium wangiae]|uniref:PAS domain S-box protein n=1 Tax=Halobacterium wangiae TaxID=2902623 RepID=UPI001E50A644|nr:PAS domain S-box protein [Halobacterium wangiae]